MESLTLARGALESMLAHARETHPEECCGAVLVEGGRDVVRRFTNIQGRLHREDPATQPRDARTAYAPEPRELFAAIRGGGAWSFDEHAMHEVGGLAALREEWSTERGHRLGTTQLSDVAHALVATGFAYVPAARDEQARILNGVLGRIRDIRRFGSAQLDLASVAAGKMDAYFESVDKPWDWKAGALLVREAGGRVTELEQKRPGQPHVVASGALVHDALVALIRNAVQSH